MEDGKETESVDVMHFIWNETWPENRSPQIIAYTLDGKTAYGSVKLESGMTYLASLKVSDSENDSINYSWEILPESTVLQEGGDIEKRPENLIFEIVSQNNGDLTFIAPESGLYRLFVYADDGNGHVATANIPFKVN
jgi:hypothetical protein